MKNFVLKDYAINQQMYAKKCKQLLFKRFSKQCCSFYVKTYGCQANVSESEKIEGILNDLGLEKVNSYVDADMIILNTCAVREKAQDKVFSYLGKILALKKHCKDKIVAVCGCMIQQENVKKRINEDFFGVDLVFGSHMIYRLAEFLYYVLSENNIGYVNTNFLDGVQEKIPINRHSRFKALVPISYGCSNYCTYCIVPFVKGKEQSRDFGSILEEVKDLVKKGYKEIVLLGQNVNSYGKDLSIKNGFSKLLIAINDIDGDFRIRFLTSHPKDFSKDLVDVIAGCDKVCKHFHIPVQSGCDFILKAMNRKYTRDEYLRLCQYIKKVIPNACFTTDIIVGFPGESYEQFKNTLDLIKNIKYNFIYNFIYSKRNGTYAATLKDAVSKKEKAKWLNQLIAIQNEISFELNKKFVGCVKRVLFEDIYKWDKNFMIGFTDENVMVVCKKDLSRVGSFCNVKICQAARTLLQGELV